VCTEEESVNMHITYSVTFENSTKREIRLGVVYRAGWEERAKERELRE
jgi:hypothetical protein